MLPAQKSVLEGHVQTVLLAIITSGVLFLAKYVFEANADRAAQQATLIALKISVDRVEMDLRSISLGYVRREDFADHEDRLRALEALARRRAN